MLTGSPLCSLLSCGDGVGEVREEGRQVGSRGAQIKALPREREAVASPHWG